MFIDINTLGPEGLAFDRALALVGLEGPSREPLGTVDARLSGNLQPEGSGTADLRGRLEATVRLQCSRCLERFPWSARSEFELAVVRRLEAEGADRTTNDDPASILVAPEGRIALEDLATEQLYLSLPLKPICRPECKGLCPSCGVNRNQDRCDCVVDDVDPRLAPLLQFRQRKVQES